MNHSENCVVFLLMRSGYFLHCGLPCDFEVNLTKINGGCQLGSKVVTHDSKSDLPLLTVPFFDTITGKTLTSHFCKQFLNT